MRGAYRAVIFDLDGVIVSTDEYHYRAWKRLAEEEGLFFDRALNESLRGVSRVESLKLILAANGVRRSREEMRRLTERKNAFYCKSLRHLTARAILPGFWEYLAAINKRGMRTAVASGSKNAKLILNRLDLLPCFDAVLDGNDIQKGKPDPEIFLKAAERLRQPPSQCLAVEDAASGAEAAGRAGMDILGVGGAELACATYRASGLCDAVCYEILE